MQRIFSLIIKEFAHIRRDPRSLAIIFLLPLSELIILGFAVNLDVNSLELGVIDEDNSLLSRQLIRELTCTEYFKLVAETSDHNQLTSYLNSGKIKLALIIPLDFEKNLLKAKKAAIQLIFDGSESYTTNLGVQYASLIIARFNRDLVVKLYQRKPLSGKLSPQLESASRVWYNPELSSKPFLIPGISAMLVMLVTILLPALSIVKEKESGTLEQLIVTPLKPAELVLGKLVPFLLIGLSVLSLLILEMWLVFGIVPKGSLLLFYFFSAVFILATIGIGFFVSTISANQQQAMLAVIFFFILPMILLGGFVFPINNMPELIQLLTYIFPLRYFFIITRSIFLKSVGMAELLDELIALFIIILVIYSLAFIRFRKKLD